MILKKIAIFLVVLGASAPAVAAETIGGGGCASDLTLTGGSTLLGCYGRFTGNVLNNASNSQINTALDALGYGGTDVSYNLIPSANILSLGSQAGVSVNFPGLLNGLAYIGIHTGRGGPNGVGNQTSFYKIDAVNLDMFTLNPSGGSTATLLVTTPAPVPEPAAWAMMMCGFGVAGTAMRRRRTQVVHFA